MVSLLYATAAFTCALIAMIVPARTMKYLSRTNAVDRAFMFLINWTVVFCLADSVWGVAASDAIINDTFLTVMSLLFHLNAAFTPCVWLYFVEAYLGNTAHYRLFQWLAGIFFVLQAALIASNLITGQVFFITPEGAYSSGPMRKYLFYAQYFVYILITVICIVNILINKKKSSEYFSVLIFVACPIIFCTFQLIYPDAPAYSIGYTLGCCVIYSFIVTRIVGDRIAEKTREQQLEAELEESLQIEQKLAEDKLLLEKARKEAESASLAKSTFLFNMSHDIRTPMNAIIGFTGMARKNISDSAKVEDCLSKIEASSEHLLNLINEVLDMSRVESGKIHSDLKPLDLKAESEEIIFLNSENAKKHEIELCLECSSLQNKNVMADELHLNQILMNIIGNAIKYTESGGKVTYTVREESSDISGYGHYYFVVEDNGIGMSEEFLEHVYDSFSREETMTVNRIEGTGLGMSIVKRLVDYLDGTIDIKSVQGSGTTVTVGMYLKLTNQVEAVKTEEQPGEVDLTGRRVLLAEDNELNREIATDMLTESGLSVDCATNGLEALNLVIYHGVDYYDFILMDIQMPFMNGYEATDRIRALKGADKLVIIALSANAFDEDRKKSMEAGMNDHVAKPIKFNILKQTLAKYLK